MALFARSWPRVDLDRDTINQPQKECNREQAVRCNVGSISSLGSKRMNERIAQFAFLVLLLSLALLPMGCKKPPPITLSCNASAPAIYPGDPLSVTAAAGSVNPKKNTNVLYSWSGTGVTGIGNAATVATGSLDPGSYTAKAEVKEGKKG